ncbi:MAG: preprotein translocase subunit SecF [Pseudoalteromonas rhizosphaerae]|jgi:preprotein translocase subunit SecF|uniref:Protein-export membrane protein SecF n=1 Tax=Pseudoalteromonas neustonica TaxID=1840331 RepID=A0ABY3FDH0_9GAMM|nr:MULTISPECIES: protein translocase subunit SecF [Pseudoalteromonas]MBB1292718.1 protein translocase subunit SecF [Pseudoalteromonas sp. SR41-4]MBB1302570.1 protein translocase subunit SecF [Pseudoalteromonas sp. SR44-8]MBB1310722.1 protein translocase subunit SecF [Pseudoalteromonas sp. SR41-8]MBB1399095.1 protein translocase subunit SecF [Pseudoalteromonas sp. SG44-8]MBB1410608.1 protein translocase subunit SecF [Pseudoalteromonas sp. SG44-17]|tara:strand:- start:441 stop:1388 length:948 start_codon:yes stop_codon:yes gene_type:complete
MQILKLGGRTLGFMSLRKVAMSISTLLILASFASFFVKGLNFGLDFTGGTAVEVGFAQPADLKKVRSVLAENGFADASVQLFGSSQEILVRLAPRGDDVKAEVIGNQVIDALKKADDSVVMRRIEFVGPSVGEDLKEQGGLAMLTALICILIYVAFRFEWRFAVGAVSALLHDVIITLGLFSVLGLEFDLTILAAILAVIGYSLNDTIVVSDRIRENFRKVRIDDTVEIIDISLTQTLNRTLVTSITTILVLIALFAWGGQTIHGFATALLFGVFIGTYSSIYVASAVALAMGVSKEDLIPEVIEKEGADLDAMP